MKMKSSFKCQPVAGSTYQGFIAQLIEHRTGIAEVMGSIEFFSGWHIAKIISFISVLPELCFNKEI